jgi:flagellar L-ring protein precursor FlgH
MKQDSLPIPSCCRVPVLALLVSAGILSSGCQSVPQKVVVDFVEPKVAVPTPAALASRPANGSLFNPSNYRPAFEDPRARNIGDIVTIMIVENVTASQKSASTVDRNSSLSSSISALPLQTATGLATLDAGAETKNTFSGKGGTESTNAFTGSISATVIEVMPNGNLVVLGEKQIGVNQNVDVLRFSGTVDPRIMQPGNMVNSTQVANVRIESRGRGAQGEAQTVGWLSRFFLSFSPF